MNMLKYYKEKRKIAYEKLTFAFISFFSFNRMFK